MALKSFYRFFQESFFILKRRAYICINQFKDMYKVPSSLLEVIIESNPERDGICMHFVEKANEESFLLYANYDEALAIANELIDFVNQNKDE